MKKVNLLGLSVVATAILVGCGGGSGGTAVKTGTGYYVDAPIEGVNYKCGSKTGITDKDGKFIFEQGTGCEFYVGGIKLREVSKDELKDGKKVLENDIEVAQFLQSIDVDGNLSNGIQITKDVLKVLNEALKGKKDIPKGEELEKTVSEVEQQVPHFKGKVRTKEEVVKHLEKTATQITKELLAGKTFYAFINDEGEKEVVKITINKDATTFKGEVLIGDDKGEKFDATLEVKGDKIFIGDDEGLTFFVVHEKANYIELKNSHNIAKLFATEAEAKAEYEKLVKNNPLSAENLKSLLAGKTLYIVDDKDGKAVVSPVIINSNATTIKIGINDSPEAITIKDGVIIDHQGNKHYIDKVTDKYIKGYDEDGEFIFYFNKADAEAALKGNGGSASTPSSLAKLFVGKTYYIAVDDEDNKHVETLSFSNDGHTATVTWQENGTLKKKVFAYKILGDKIVISGTRDNGTPFKLTISNVSKKSNYIEFTKKWDKDDHAGSGKLYFTKADAEAALSMDNDEDGTEGYVEHGKTKGVVTYHPDVKEISKVEFDTNSNELKIYFKEAMQYGDPSHVKTTGDYVPVDANFINEKTYVMKFSKYKPGGKINFMQGYFVSVNGNKATQAFSIKFPN